MTPHVIDLVSSSPELSTSLPESKASQQPSRHRLAPIDAHGSRCCIPPSHFKKRLSSTCSQQSAQYIDGVDDFDELDDDVFDLLENQQPKCGRTTERIDAQINSEKVHSALSKPLLPFKEKDNRFRNRAVLEPIEFTSSLEPISPAQENISRALSSRTPGHTKADGNSEKEDPVTCFSSDPFASSPYPHLEKPLSGKRAVSLDPFRSSPPPSFTTSQSQNNDLEYGKRKGLPSRQVGISRHSIIEGHGASVVSRPTGDGQLSREAHERIVLGDLITIDDSDSLSDANDDLPAISDINVSQHRRVRSPLRRSQSDLTWSKPRAAQAATSTKRPRPQKSAQDREMEKARKRHERDEAKAAKAAEKQHAAALVEVNKLRTDKKVSTPEMIVDLPSGLSSELRIQVEEMLQGLGVDYTTWDSPQHSIVKWRRKVTCKYNDDMGLWEPIPARIVNESIAISILPAEQFVAMALQDSLATHVAETRSICGGMKMVYLLQGMTPWLRRNRNNRNRQFASGVRSLSGPVSSSARAGAGADYVSEDIVEEALLALQVEHDMLIHHTTIATETARWVVNFTQHVSTIPYRMQRDEATAVAGFCMESGQVRTGDSAGDTYVRMLQEIVRVTAPIAYGVAAEFDSVTKLVQGLESGGPERLESVRKSTNKDGVASDRTLGQAISRRMYKVFTGTDEESTDV
ncbi:hypothetical protein ED733_001302 [Metarhizium rileyi]|uniref:ERCC4 domain-containing protein n=1 Tax=Metarhizium rileyi (strain RCEF 4871) TaxID=1649241 RepID=A0A5C6G0U4_METRR|nr:hypothetical protein ED733_001302 [Metarhizium rileyi]